MCGWSSTGAKESDEVDSYRRLGWSMIDTEEICFLEPEV
jgi:hypothetical protein